MKTFALAAATLLMTGVAAPALAQSADWSGPYVGVHAGWLFSGEEEDESLIFDRDFDGAFDDQVVLSGSGANAFSPGSCDGQARSNNAGAGCSGDDTGVEAGVRLGYDFQFGNFVVGAVGEWSATDAEDSVTSFSTTPASYVFTRNLESVAALRARVGYAMGDTLAYVTGGGAYGKIQNKFYTSNGANSFTVQSNEEDADGYQAGAGLEYKLAPNLTLVGEYMYTTLDAGEYVVRAGPGTALPTNPFILPPNTAGTDITRSNDKFDSHAVRVGMNVRF